MPASTSYQLKDYSFGSGGTSNATSTDYAAETLSGEQSEGMLTSAAYGIGTGLQYTNQANVPPAPTFTNPANYYNKLQIVLAIGSNPSDTLFAIAISTDNFATDTRYVQSDATVGASLGLEDYQTYAAWGSATGTTIIGLASGTTYTVKVKAWQGKFTETGYGPTAAVATSNPQLSFDIDIGTLSTDDNSITTLDLGSLPAGSVVASTNKVWIDLDTNGVNGGKVYVSAANGGLYSLTAGHTISSASGNLSVLSTGFGAQGSSVAQGSGGPLAMVSPYDGTSDTVGVTDTTIREIFSTSAPITAGRGSFVLKAKSANTTPAALDYVETLTIIASGSF
jgi:hypothetical protein